MELSTADLAQIKEKGISQDTLYHQLQVFKEGVDPIELVRCCSPGHGIEILDEESIATALTVYETAKTERVIRFVPASGAASRMFKFLHHEASGQQTEAGDRFFSNIEKFPFWNSLKAVCQKLDEPATKMSRCRLAKLVLGEEGLGCANYPKGLIPFHFSPSGQVRTPFEEHLIEAGMQANGQPGKTAVHFTVSGQHRQRIQDLIKSSQLEIGKHTGVAYDINLSEQKPETDTLAVDMENQPVRDRYGKLLFRPGGHGALLSNLQELQADIVFIQNIDNITSEGQMRKSVKWKRILGGKLIAIRRRVHDFLRRLECADGKLLEEMAEFCHHVFEVDVPVNRQALRNVLDRPIRVCGMVENRGEPGGGPFWVRSKQGTISKQIIEKAQVDGNDQEQQSILRSATHFNPVEIVCSITQPNQEAYRLEHFIDDNARFIAHKNHEGREIKAQELPGLWNGAMAFWNTVFVEIPPAVFNPVKTVNDLLKPAHQL